MPERYIRVLFKILKIQLFHTEKKIQLRVQSAPLNQFIATRMFFYIYHPAFVNDLFKTKLENVTQSCPDLAKYDSEFHISECCERSPNGEFGHLNQLFAKDARFQGKHLSVTRNVATCNCSVNFLVFYFLSSKNKLCNYR